MEHLIKELKRFLARDLLYIIGGSCVVLSFLNLYGELPSTDLPTVSYILGAGIAYVVGYTIKDGLSMFLVVRWAPLFKLRGPFRWLFYACTRQPWTDLIKDNKTVVYTDLIDPISPRQAEALDRLTHIQHICSTMGSCGLISSIFLFAKGSWTWGSFDGALAWSVLAVTLVLLVLNRVNSAHEGLAIAKILKANREKSEERNAEASSTTEDLGARAGAAEPAAPLDRGRMPSNVARSDCSGPGK